MYVTVKNAKVWAYMLLKWFDPREFELSSKLVGLNWRRKIICFTENVYSSNLPFQCIRKAKLCFPQICNMDRMHYFRKFHHRNRRQKLNVSTISLILFFPKQMRCLFSLLNRTLVIVLSYSVSHNLLKSVHCMCKSEFTRVQQKLMDPMKCSRATKVLSIYQPAWRLECLIRKKEK